MSSPPTASVSADRRKGMGQTFPCIAYDPRHLSKFWATSHFLRPRSAIYTFGHINIIPTMQFLEMLIQNLICYH